MSSLCGYLMTYSLRANFSPMPEKIRAWEVYKRLVECHQIRGFCIYMFIDSYQRQGWNCELHAVTRSRACSTRTRMLPWGERCFWRLMEQKFLRLNISGKSGNTKWMLSCEQAINKLHVMGNDANNYKVWNSEHCNHANSQWCKMSSIYM